MLKRHLPKIWQAFGKNDNVYHCVFRFRKEKCHWGFCCVWQFFCGLRSPLLLGRPCLVGEEGRAGASSTHIKFLDKTNVPSLRTRTLSQEAALIEGGVTLISKAHLPKVRPMFVFLFWAKECFFASRNILHKGHKWAMMMSALFKNHLYFASSMY